MARFKFGDKVKTLDGKDATVQEDQEANSPDVKIMLEGDDYSHIVKDSQLELINDENT